jgi:hypothetical protein
MEREAEHAILHADKRIAQNPSVSAASGVAEAIPCDPAKTRSWLSAEFCRGSAVSRILASHQELLT